MKHTLFGILTCTLLLSACSKDNDSPSEPDPYMSYTNGSNWHYSFKDNNDASNNYNYVVTATNQDTLINTKTYRKFSVDNGTTQYYNITGHDYYTFAALPLQVTTQYFENLYMKDNATVGTQWVQSYNIDLGGVPIAVQTTNTIASIGGTKVVNGTTYNDVIQVTTTIAPPSGIPGITLTSNINFYYAPIVGMIENDIVLSFSGLGMSQDVNTQTTLTSATIL